MQRVLVREPIAEAGIELLRQRFEVDVKPDGDLAETIGGYDAIIIRSATQVTADLLERAERLKVIGRAGVGVDNVDLAAASKRGVVVANAPESTVVSAAEHTFGLLLALTRQIPQAHAALEEGRWERSQFAGLELADKTLGLVGFGRIGQQVARRARGFEMRVRAYDPYVAPERFRELGVDRAETVEDLFADADYVSLHATLTPETRGLVDRKRIAGMKDGVRIVNVARGELVDEDALVEGLQSGKVAGAALDVFAEEPYSGPLLGLPNVVVTPHLAASTQEAQDRAGVIVAEQVAAALEGGVVTNALNVPAIAAEDLDALAPFIPLAADLGSLAIELAGGSGEAARFPLPRRVGRAGHPHPHGGRPERRLPRPRRGTRELRERAARRQGARNRGARGAATASRHFKNLITVTAVAGEEEFPVSGTTTGRDNEPRLVRALGYDVEIALEPLMLFVVNDDRPGRIGRLGTILGDAGVNIANMAVSRNRPRSRALMVLTLDTPIPSEVLDCIRAEPGLLDPRAIALERGEDDERG